MPQGTTSSPLVEPERAKHEVRVQSQTVLRAECEMNVQIAAYRFSYLAPSGLAGMGLAF
jgi:hypothetical protein